jgi:hypothetical protein
VSYSHPFDLAEPVAPFQITALFTITPGAWAKWIAS